MPRSPLPLVALVAGLLSANVPFVQAAEDPRVAALVTADNTRVTAMLSPTEEGLSAMLSDSLRYAHSNGVVDTKASFMESLLQKKQQYLSLDYEERTFSFPAPEVALMSGKVHFKGRNPGGDVDAILMFLAVWKLEAGQWRFLAWQSCRLPATPPKDPVK
ncbi:MAG: nuclear transport factor 2 family protein [Verrucomicrobiota bacterium]